MLGAMKCRPGKIPWRALLAGLLCATGCLAMLPAQAQGEEGGEAAVAAVGDSSQDAHALTQAVVKTRPYQILLLFTFVLAIFLGVELISKVPSQLHTPLMSGANAISGITIVGALLAAGQTEGRLPIIILGFLAVVCATINVVGGYLVTNRMLSMFKHKEGK